MNSADEIQQMMVEYSIAIDMSLGHDSNSRRRMLKCGFCTRTYKYHTILENHIFSKDNFKTFFYLKKQNKNRFVFKIQKAYVKSNSTLWNGSNTAESLFYKIESTGTLSTISSTNFQFDLSRFWESIRFCSEFIKDKTMKQ